MSDAVQEWQGWRRHQGNTWESWRKVEGAAGATKAECYGNLMRLSELTGSFDVGPWEYRIMPVGEVPSRDGPGGQTYGTREMKPRW